MLGEEQKGALKWLEENGEMLAKFNDEIWGYAEPALREYLAAKAYGRLLRRHGFEVCSGVAGMPTAFVARFGKGNPVLGFYAEYDATPGNSQAPVPYRQPVVPRAAGWEDLHNSLGVGSAGAALATKYVMEKHDMKGTLLLFGTPAEKLCVGKPYMARDGLFDELDATLAWHPWDRNTVTWDDGPDCYQAVIYVFQGVASYGGRPWGGVSALDAVTVMNVMVNYLKEHVPRDWYATVNELITVGGQCPTNLPESSEVWYVFRAKGRQAIQSIQEMLDRAAEAASVAMQCPYTKRIASATRPWVPNHGLARLVYRNLEIIGPPAWSEEDKAFCRKIQQSLGMEMLVEPLDGTVTCPWIDKEAAQFHGGADDVNEFSWHSPTAWLHVAYCALGPKDFSFPSWAGAAVARTPIAHKCLLTAARVLACSAVELLADPSRLAEIKAEYLERTKNGLMPVAIPKDARPPIEHSFPPYYPEGWKPPTGIGDGR